MGVLSSSVVYPRTAAVRVYVDADVQIRDTANETHTIAYTTHLNPLRFAIRISNGATAHDQALEVMIRTVGSNAQKEIFDLAGAVTTTADGVFIFSPTSGSATGQTVVNYTVPLLDNWIAGDNLYVVLKAAVAPTEGSCSLVVVAFY